MRLSQTAEGAEDQLGGNLNETAKGRPVLRSLQDFTKEAAEINRDLLSDPLTEHARKQQKALLIASALAVAVLLSFVKLKSAEAAYKLEFADFQSFIVLIFLLVIYYTILFVAAAATDYKVRRYGLTYTAARIDVLNEEGREHLAVFSSELQRCTAQLYAVLAERRRLDRERSAERRRLFDEAEKLQEEGRYKEASDLIENASAVLQQPLPPDTLDELSARQTELVEAHGRAASVIEARMGHVLKSLRFAKRVGWFRWAFEVLFPLGLATWAVALCLRHLNAAGEFDTLLRRAALLFGE